MLVAARLGVTPPLPQSHIVDLQETALWTAGRGLDVLILRRLLELAEHSTVGLTGKAFITQVKLIAFC